MYLAKSARLLPARLLATSSTLRTTPGSKAIPPIRPGLLPGRFQFWPELVSGQVINAVHC